MNTGNILTESQFNALVLLGIEPDIYSPGVYSKESFLYFTNQHPDFYYYHYKDGTFVSYHTCDIEDYV